MKARYLIRLDDASEFMEHKKWDPFFSLFLKYNISPIIAVIPYNRDPQMVNDKPDPRFWDKARSWERKNYHIALHGFRHLYTTNKSGIIGMNKRSEFAGIPYEMQVEMIKSGYEKFKEEGICTNIFVAPAHSFDKNTVKAIRVSTKIEYISDGLNKYSFLRDGMKWIPSQLGRPKVKRNGVWTLCIHPETLSKRSFYEIESFISRYHQYFVDVNDLGEFKKYNSLNFMYGACKLLEIRIKRIILEFSIYQPKQRYF